MQIGFQDPWDAVGGRQLGVGANCRWRRSKSRSRRVPPGVVSHIGRLAVEGKSAVKKRKKFVKVAFETTHLIFEYCRDMRFPAMNRSLILRL